MGLVETELDPDRNLIIQKVTGNLILQDFVAAFNKAINHKDFRSGMNVLWDLTNASLADANVHDIHEIIKFVKYHIDKRGTNFKLAIVANSKLEFGLSRVYEAYSDPLPFAKGVFYDMQEAIKWISDR